MEPHKCVCAQAEGKHYVTVFMAVTVAEGDEPQSLVCAARRELVLLLRESYSFTFLLARASLQLSLPSSVYLFLSPPTSPHKRSQNDRKAYHHHHSVMIANLPS